MTKIELYTTIRSIFKNQTLPEDIETIDEIIMFCDKEIDALKRKAERAKAASKAKQAEYDETLERIVEALTMDYTPIDEIVERIGIEGLTRSKVIFRLNALVNEGRADKAEIVVGGEDGQKKRKVQGYALPANIED